MKKWMAGFVASMAIGCAADIDGAWCGEEVDSAEACENSGSGNDMWFAELTDEGDTVTGRLCEDGYANAQQDSGCVAVDGPFVDDVLRLEAFGKDGQALELTLEGDMLSGDLGGFPIVLHRIP